MSGLGEGGRLALGYVSKSARAQIQIGDLVITSGMRSIYPEGLRIGIVETVRGEAYETSLRIEVIPAVDFSSLEYVFVIGEDE